MKASEANPDPITRPRSPTAAYGRLAAAAISLVVCGLPGSTRGATLTWWATGSTGVAGGAGSWDTTNARWTADGSSWASWNNGNIDIAVFGGATAGTVTLSSGITANGLTFNTAGYTISSNTLTLAGGTATITLNANAATINSIVAGTAALQKLGSGTLTLAGDNTYSGGTVVDAGVLQLSGSNNGTSRVGSGTLTINTGATVLSTVDNVLGWGDSAVTPSVVINRGAWDAQAFGASFKTATLNSGTLTRSGGFWYFNQSGQITSTGASLITGGTMMLRPAGGNIMPMQVDSGTLTISTVLANDSGTAGFNKTGDGTMLLTARNTYTGTTSISAGTLELGGSGQLGSGSYAVAIPNAGRFVVSTSANQTLSGVISGTGTLVKSGAGTLTLTGTNTYSGGTIVNSGTLILRKSDSNTSVVGSGTLTINAGAVLLSGSDNVLGWDNSSVTPSVVINGGTWDAQAFGASFKTATLNNGTLTRSSGVWYFGQTGQITSTGASLITGGTMMLRPAGGNIMPMQVDSGTLTIETVLANDSGAAGFNKTGAGTMLLTATNSYSGTTSIAAGMVQIGNNGTTGSLSTSSVITGSAGGTLGFNRTNAVAQGTAFSHAISGGLGLSQLGSGTLTLSGSNTYTGPTTAGAGVLRFDTLAAGSGTQSLGSGTVVNLGVAATSAGELNYFGSGGTLDKNVFALGAGRNRIKNSGVGTLGLSGTLMKDGTILELAGGTFSVTGQITGSSANSDFLINGASVTLSNTNNNYNGPTYVYGNGTLTLGASNVVPTGSALLLGGTGSDTGAGTIVTGTFTDTVASLTTSALSGTVGITVSGAKAGGLTMTDLTLGGSSDTLALTLSGLTQTRYQLLTYTGVRSGTFDTVTGLNAAPNYTIVYGSGSNGSIALALKADQTLSLTPAASRVLVGGSTSLNGTLVNSQATGGAGLAVSLSSNGTLMANSFSSSTGEMVTAGGTSTISATLIAGNTAGSQSWKVVNTDNGAITTSATSSGSISVVNQRTFTTSTSTLALGLVHQGASFGLPTLVVTSTGLYATTASGTLGSFTDGPAGLSLGLTSGSVAFNGASSPQSATYTLAGNASTPGTISGTFTSSVSAELGAISDVSVAVTGQVFSGTATWTVAGGGGWGSGASANWTSAGGVGAAPGTFAGYASTDVAIFAGSQGGTSTILLGGAAPSLASIAFTNTTGRYVIDQGSGGSLTLAATTGKPTVDVAANVLAEINTGILGSQGLQKTGAGTLVLSGSNGYSGGTDVSAGTLRVDGAVGGAVNVASAAVLAGAGTIGSLVTVLGGGILAPGNGGPGTVVAVGGLSLADAAILNFQLSSTNVTPGGGINDLVAVTGDFTLDGILNVAAIGSGDFTGVANGASWRLFNYSGGNFTNGGLVFGSMPALGGDRYFAVDTSTAGVVNLVIVPEPGSLVLGGIGIAGGAWVAAKRRSRKY